MRQRFLKKSILPLKLISKNDFSVIIVSNSCDISPNFNDSELPTTTKKHKQLHGFGLKSVKKTLKKYNGDIDFEYDCEKNRFIVTVFLEV